MLPTPVSGFTVGNAQPALGQRLIGAQLCIQTIDLVPLWVAPMAELLLPKRPCNLAAAS
jgi:hypothetical protein